MELESGLPNPLRLAWEALGITKRKDDWGQIEHAGQMLRPPKNRKWVVDGWWRGFEEGFPPDLIGICLKPAPRPRSVRRWLREHKPFSQRYIKSFSDYIDSIPQVKGLLINSLIDYPGPDYRQAVNGLIKLIDEIEVRDKKWREGYRLPSLAGDEDDKLSEIDSEEAYLASLK